MAATRAKPAKVPAEQLPIARVVVDLPLPHLDREFDYQLTAEQAAVANPGCRLRVRFAGRLVDAYLLSRHETSEHEGRLAFVDRVVSGEPVLHPEVAELARAAADRWAGTFADVVRLAVPPRHATVEAEPARAAVATTRPTGELHRYAGGDAMLAHLANGESPRAAIAMLPGDWPREVAAAVAATMRSGRGAIAVVPDYRDLARVDAALADVPHVALTADLGPAERYRRFLAVSRGHVRCAIGTRAAVWAPVADLGLVVVWDDGDDLLAEPRAPYCHARDVALLRAHQSGAALLIAGPSISAETASLAESEWLTILAPDLHARTTSLPTVRAVDDDGRLPTDGWQAARDALAAGAPVLVQVPRRGYLLNLVCASCRLPARCAHCAGPLGRARADAAPACRWCARGVASWRCPECGGDKLRAVQIGSARTAEELGRAFPGVTVKTSSGDTVIADVPDKPAIVVATPGAEPVAHGGYGAALLLDGWALLSRADLRAGEEALRRWLVAASLVRPGGQVVVVAPGELRPVQALIRWQPAWYAERELADRTALHLPPAARMAALTGPAAAIKEVLTLAELPPGAETLGPVAAGAKERMIVRVPRRHGAALAAALKAGAAIRSARKSGDAVRIEIDPYVLA